jgi:hypothetical protein
MMLRSGSIDRILRAALVGMVVLLAATTGQAREEVLRWTHANPDDVVRFEAHFGTSPGSYDQIVDLQKPAPDGNGIYQATIEVGDADVYIALRAIGAASVQSPLSNERERASDTGGGGGGGEPTSPVPAGTPMTASPDAAKRFDFANLPTGTSVAEWQDTAANNSLTTDDSLFQVSNVDGNRLFLTRSTANDIHSHVVGSDVPWTNFTMRGRMAMNTATGQLGVTTYSQFPSEDVYYRLGRASTSGAFTISGHPSISCAAGNTGVTPVAGTWYEFELAVTNESGSNRIEAKVWAQGAAEPNGPQASCTDSRASRPTVGTMGVWASGTGEKYWDDLEVVVRAPAPSGPLQPPILIQIVPVE